jgi:glutamate-1-semialdehyde aminotransferase
MQNATGQPSRENQTGKSPSKPGRFIIPHLLRRGVRIAGRGNWFLSAAHSNDDVDRTLYAFEGALKAYSQTPEQ